MNKLCKVFAVVLACLTFCSFTTVSAAPPLNEHGPRFRAGPPGHGPGRHLPPPPPRHGWKAPPPPRHGWRPPPPPPPHHYWAPPPPPCWNCPPPPPPPRHRRGLGIGIYL